MGAGGAGERDGRVVMGGDPESGGAGSSVGPIPKVDRAMSEVAWSPFDTLCRVQALLGAFGVADDHQGSQSDCLRGIHLLSLILSALCLCSSSSHHCNIL
jgi:hypothetical protein